MAVDAFARLTAAKTADLGSSALGKGGSLIALPYGGTVGDLSSSYRDAVFATATTSVEAAHAMAIAAGKARVVINGLNWVANGSLTTLTLPIEFLGGATCSAAGFLLNFSKGFRADDMAAIFAPGDAARITLPAWQRLTPFHFGAKADYISSVSPGTDDGPALNAWASRLCLRVMPRGNYGTTMTVDWNGDETGVNDANGIIADPSAKIIQRTDNIPIMTFYGARGSWSFPKLEFMNVQNRDNWSAICLLCTTRPGGGNGFYRNKVDTLHTRGGAVSVFFPTSFSSTLSSAALAGAISIQVTNPRTEHNSGTRTWVAGLWIQIELDSGAFHTTRITSSNASTPCTLTLRDPLPSAAAAGKVAVHAQVQMTTAVTPFYTPTRASNVWVKTLMEQPTRYGWVCVMNGTQDAFVERYLDGSLIGSDVTVWTSTLINGIYETGRNGDRHGVTNVEHFQSTGDAWSVSGEPASLGNVHFEGVRLQTDGTGFVGGLTESLSIDTMKVVYCTILGTDIATAAALFAPRIPTSTVLGGQKGVWRIGQLHTTKNIFTPGRAFMVRDSSTSQTRLDIGTWNYDRDSGLYPTGQLSSSVTNANPVRIGNLFPDNVMSYRLDADITITTAQDMYSGNKGQFKVNKLVYMWPTRTPTVATAGVFRESGAVNLVSAVNNTALSALTTKSGTAPGSVIEPGLAAAEATILRGSGARLYFKCLAAESAPAAVTGASSYLTGRNGGSSRTNIGFINFGAAHGFSAGDIVVISGSVNAALNATFKIVDVPSTTQIAVYADSATAVGSAGAPVADAAIAVQLRPTINVFALGDDYGF